MKSNTGIALSSTEKNYRIGKRQAMMIYIDSSFTKFTSIHNRLALEMRRCLENANIPECKGKTTLIHHPPTTKNNNKKEYSTDWLLK